MGASRYVGRVGGLAVGLGVGAALLFGAASAWASPDSDSGPASTSSAHSARQAKKAKPAAAARTRSTPVARPATPTVAGPRRTAGARATVSVSATQESVNLPAMPVESGASFTVSRDFMAGFAADYIAAGGDPADSPRFFFGDLAVASLDALADPAVTPDQTRLLLGNLAASGYFGGIWLRDNLRDTATATVAPAVVTAAAQPVFDLSPSAIALHLFDGVAAGLVGAAQSNPWIVNAVAHVSVPVLLALYGYNKGYLDVVLENPPAGVPSMADTLSCNGFLDCNSSAVPLELATRYDSALAKLDSPTTLGWAEMAVWSKVLESATGAGRFVWQAIVAAGGLSPTSYAALVDLSSAYLMVSKAAVLSSMIAAADGDAAVGASSLRLQAGLWTWSGSYFAGLASSAPTGTLPSIVVS
ncbi:hypothetical protein OG976_01590 [Mycobacterium sp. NBC_00419]|uniref:hypothetical protein n=1 Tax=Mycobacterium sp. NBC_00419 TaxID=2975989 RepID=UPI002E203A2D